MSVLNGNDDLDFNKFTDVATTAYGEVCGAKTYELELSDGSTPSFLILSDNNDGTMKITLTPVLNDPIGTTTVKLIFTITEYAD